MKKFLILVVVLFSMCACDKLDLKSSFGYPNKTNDSIVTDNLDKEVNYDGNLIVHFLDVGQADSIFIELPNKECMLIDAGEKSNSEKIINYIDDLNYKKIDYVVGTHPHADHIGGLSDVINHFDIGNIYMPKVVATSKTYENLLNTIASKNLKIKSGKSGVNVIDEDGLNISFLAPNKDKYSGYNNYSIVVKIVYGRTSYLFMGDAEAISEKEITSDLASDILKVGHHGSDTSSSEEFLDKVKPKYAIISVGENNKYNHPASITLDKLKKYTSNIYRTDINGNIIISSDGNDYDIKLEKGEI
ncbi:MAG: MBL fold metallo-hydrolase [Ruminococcus sp.]|nr:MBL fold metallo-hydrolase [Ruminococcus sp.]